MGRGDLIRRISTGVQLLEASDDEMEKIYKRQIVNMQGNAVGSMNAFVKKVGGAIISIDTSIKQMAEKVDGRNPNKELRKMIEEIGNVEKMIK